MKLATLLGAALLLAVPPCHALDWAGAQYVGAQRVDVSPYRSTYNIDVDIALTRSGDKATLVWGARPGYRCTATLSREQGKYWLSLGHDKGDSTFVDGREDVTPFVSEPTQRLTLKVFAAQYCKTYKVDPYLNDSLVVNRHVPPRTRPLTLIEQLTAERPAQFTIDLRPDGYSNDSRLYALGVETPQGSKAKAANLRLSEPVWGYTLYEQRIVAPNSGTVLPGEGISTPVFRRDFTLSRAVKKATLHATAHGIYEAEVNGHKVSSDYLAPGWADYRVRQYYNTYDITPLLRGGDNTLTATVADGWWTGFVGFHTHWQDQYGIEPALMAQIVIDYADGTTERIVTDGKWLSRTDGPVTTASLQNGEDYDARLVAGPHWEPVRLLGAQPDNVILQPYTGRPITAHEVLTAKAVTSPRPGAYIYDMGQNMVGIPQIGLRGHDGDTIRLRYAEMLWPATPPASPTPPYTRDDYRHHAGQLYTDNYRSALSRDSYICRDGWQTIEPRFTQHGYRYIEIAGLREPLPPDSVRGLVMHSLDDKPRAAFECGNQLVNQLFQNIQWGQRGNFLAVPTDCPQRDERLGYTGDGQVFALSATYNYDVLPIMSRWLEAVRDGQGDDGSIPNFAPIVDTPPCKVRGNGSIGWGDAIVIIPWTLYTQYADTTALRDNWPAMTRYMQYLQDQAEGHLQKAGGLADWLGVEDCNSQIVNTAYWAYDALLMAKIARVLGDDQAANHFDRLHADIKREFNATFLRPDGTTFTPAGYKTGKWLPKAVADDTPDDTQASYVLALKAELLDDPATAVSHLRASIARHGDKLTTGFLSTPHLNPMLSRYGADTTAYTLLLQEECPGWLYPVKQGATTIWERWNSYSLEHGFGPVVMNSFNHYSYGAVEEWLIQYVLGIQSDEAQPGYKHFLLDPRPDSRLGFARGHLDTVSGTITAEWNADGHGGFDYLVTIPQGTTATFQNRTLTPGTHKLKLK